MIELPEHRSLPPEVRDRIRQRVLAGEPPTRRVPVLAVAAAVLLVLVAALATTVIRSTPGEVAPATPAPPAGPQPRPTGAPTEADTERCWQATRRTPHPERYPDRASWQPVGAFDGARRFLFGYRTAVWLAGDQPLVCTFTRSSVLVSDPAAEPLPSAAAQVRLRAATPDGVLVGTLAKPELRSTVVPPDRLAKDELATRGPAFALVGEWSSPETPVELGGTPVKAPTGYGLLRVVDRPVAQGDRDSETGRALGACMARRAATGYPVADAEAWQPGPSLPGPAGTRFLLGYYGDSVGSCLRSADGTGDFLASSEESAPGRISVVYGSALAPDVRTTSAPTCEFLWGRLTGAARQVVFTGPNGETAQAQAGVNGLFVAAVPVRRTLPDNGIRFGVSVRDGEGKQIEYYQVLQ